MSSQIRQTSQMIRYQNAAIAGIVAATAATALIYFPFRRELRDARRAVDTGSRVIATDAGTVEYAEAGKGFPLLSIHGAGGGYDQGLALAAIFAGNDFRVIAPSRFGYLRTPVPVDASAAAQADAHFALLKKLNIQKAVVVGTSAGAASAVELALRHPKAVAALILVVPGIYSPTTPVRADTSTRGGRFTLWLVNHGADFAWWAMEKLAPSVLIRFFGVRPEVAAAATDRDRRRIADFVRNTQPLSLRVAGISAERAPELPPAYENITAPTLIISARDDLYNTFPAAKYAAERIPQARLVVYDSGGHLLVGREEHAQGVVRDFLFGLKLKSRSRAAAHTPERFAVMPRRTG
jgi:pimeloyl-ACP methyl ester carboxylesterase